jgi:tetratricopeptide (TPR) repeat protein
VIQGSCQRGRSGSALHHYREFLARYDRPAVGHRGFAEEAKAATSGADKASVLLELAEAYQKLNNDNQMISALNGAVQQDPSRLEIYDRLAALYESKKRWPDLVKVLSEKAERSSTQDEKVTIYLQVANLYLERFSNQAEAIKACEEGKISDQTLMKTLLGAERQSQLLGGGSALEGCGLGSLDDFMEQALTKKLPCAPDWIGFASYKDGGSRDWDCSSGGAGTAPGASSTG